jgi:hypothetical protein
MAKRCQLSNHEKKLFGLLTSMKTYGVMLHGTSTVAYEKIKVEGIKPRGKCKATWVGGGKPGKCDRIYLQTEKKFGCDFESHMASRFAAVEAAEKHGGTSILLRVQLKPEDFKNIAEDEDVHDCLKEEWHQSEKYLFEQCLPEDISDFIAENNYNKKEVAKVMHCLPMKFKSLVCQGSISIKGGLPASRIIGPRKL